MSMQCACRQYHDYKKLCVQGHLNLCLGNYFSCCQLTGTWNLSCFQFASLWRNSPTWSRAASCSRFLDHTKLHITVGRTSLDEGSVRRGDLCLTTHNTDIHAPSGIPTRNPSKRTAIDPRLRPLDHWDRHYLQCRWFMHLIFLETLKTFDPCWLQTSIMLSACNSHAPQPHVCF